MAHPVGARGPLHTSAFTPVSTRAHHGVQHGRAFLSEPHRVVQVAQILEAAWLSHHAPYDDPLIRATWADVATLITAMVRQRGHGRRLTTLRLVLADHPLDAGTRMQLHSRYPRMAWWTVQAGDAFVVPDV